MSFLLVLVLQIYWGSYSFSGSQLMTHDNDGDDHLTMYGTVKTIEFDLWEISDESILLMNYG